ncbi:hypothetical protein JTB14_036247 [Gonioctena quinquepunctata]|nr:hypothetical protein JTB14_036247 [Gonioctena quinquepunctata]
MAWDEMSKPPISASVDEEDLMTELINPAITIIELIDFGVIPTRKVGFFCKNPDLSHEPYRSTVPTSVLGITAVIVPALAILITDLGSHQSSEKTILTSWILYRELMIGIISDMFLVYMIKALMGGHRPYFFEVCKPDTGKLCTKGAFLETFVCTCEENSFHENLRSYQSFPSLHASLAWFAGTYSSYIINKRLDTTYVGSLMKPFLIAVFLTWSLICSLSGLVDAAHHWWDVVAGIILGISVSFYNIFAAEISLQEMADEIRQKEIEKKGR